MKNIKNAIVSHSSGILLALFLALISMALSQLPFFARAHISPLIIGIFLSIGIAVALSVMQGAGENATFITAFHAKTKDGINFSAKKSCGLASSFMACLSRLAICKVSAWWAWRYVWAWWS
ncbi:hypothetical protein BKN38_09375 [Helicobacter sp. CLO-3]|uniref:hypothetical protein n=1 Tax=unclassified Helicobacter TaxID=2593540 RepID=UPI000804892C|nr:MULTISPECIES: hypothetical protein [unclassified Helicobacter]OBV28627.1 hypothetical protein BA723_01805 [Helicobacter sp. CLO-3]OHU81298.1 hypothetical protein BKN38_09375 [Helicobacter sp. CLO-3]